MAKSNLVIVESPAKAKTIGKYLGPDYQVKASMGHVRDLPKSKIGVDVEHGFVPDYQPIKGKEEVISDLKKETDLWAGVNVANLNKGQRLLDAWSPTNPDSNIPALSTYNNNNETRVSSYYVENGSFLKLRNIQIGYNVPKAIANKLYMERLRFYLSAQNLLTIKSSSFTGVDPENANFGYPIPVNMTFGLNVTF